MMKKLTSRKLVAMLVVALFMLFFAGIAVSQESQEPEVVKITGMISAIWPDIGQIIVEEKESGKAVSLTAGSDVDLKNFNVGDHVVVEYNDDTVLKSINKQTE
ncbi:MAG: hypothetical protein KKA75_05460 [Proteobacteria bacterium]|nr:hypothetical protein [Pseudomonadota bacterium]